MDNNRYIDYNAQPGYVPMEELSYHLVNFLCAPQEQAIEQSINLVDTIEKRRVGRDEYMDWKLVVASLLPRPLERPQKLHNRKSEAVVCTPPPPPTPITLSPRCSTWQMPHRPLERLLPQEYLALPKYFLKKRLCVHCGVYYYEYANMGELYCRLHTGVRQYDDRRGGYFYSCCDSEDERGCTEADHMDETLSNELEARWTQLQTWLQLAVPRILYNYGLVPPRHRQVLLDISLQSQLERGLARRLPFGNRQLSLQARPIGQLLAQQATRSRPR